MKRKILIIFCLILIAFSIDDNKNDYNVPRAAYSVCTADLDLDGDKDIVVGHLYNWQTEWTGISILKNNININQIFQLDSFYLNGQHRQIILRKIDFNQDYDLITQCYDGQHSQIGILYDFNSNQDNLVTYEIDAYADYIAIGDVNNDNHEDIVCASNNGQFWGILYNDGQGGFSEPEYHYVEDYYPNDIACGDLNGDSRDDVVICGQSTEVYFSYTDGFQPLVLETGNYKEGVSIVDFDLDGDNDILTFVGIPFVNVTSLIMYENQGNNVFDTIPEFYFRDISSRFFITDFNNDSLQDILFQLTDNSGYILYYNKKEFQLGDSLFIPVDNYEYDGLFNCYCTDIDGNGYNDIIITRLSQIILPANLTILFNDGNGNFVEDPVTNIKRQYPESQKPLLCYPNPFTIETTFELAIKETTQVELSVYDIQGKLIINLINKNMRGENYQIKWYGFDQGGKQCEPGIYIAYLKVNGKSHQTNKLIKLN